MVTFNPVLCIANKSLSAGKLRPGRSSSLKICCCARLHAAVNAADFLPAPANTPRPKDGLHDRVVVSTASLTVSLQVQQVLVEGNVSATGHLLAAVVA